MPVNGAAAAITKNTICHIPMAFFFSAGAEAATHPLKRWSVSSSSPHPAIFVIAIDASFLITYANGQVARLLSFVRSRFSFATQP
jgi:hypothetical protein